MHIVSGAGVAALLRPTCHGAKSPLAGRYWAAVDLSSDCPALRSPACGITQGHVLMGITENKDVAGLSGSPSLCHINRF